MFNPTRLSFARRRRGLSKVRLAELVGITARSITAHEAGEKEPLPETVEAFSRELRFPVEFFFEGDLDEVNPDSASFRSLSSLTAGKRDAAIAAASIAVLLGRWLHTKFVLPTPAIPEFHEATDPESAAASVRLHWGLGQRPVGNLVHALEAHGVRVFSLSEDCRHLDAISLWDGATPYVLLNTIKSPERSRFDAAHELGHLVLHRHGSPTGRQAEEEANTFAAAFLMPREALIARGLRAPALSSIMEGKRNWGVSAMAYAFRLHRVQMMSDWYYHQIARKLSVLGFRSSEGERPRESSQVLGKVFEHMRGIGMTKGDLARELRILPSELDRFIFGLVITGLEGGAESSGLAARPAGLRLVRP